MAAAEQDVLPWRMCQPASPANPGQYARSPFDPAKESDADDSDMGEGTSQLDDTFHFKKHGVE